jgi:hypothetical protein
MASMRPHLRLLDLKELFLARLSKAQETRRRQWLDYERGVMLFMVNEERYHAGLDLITAHDIERACNDCGGHSDYSSKFALRCAQMALGI